MKCWIIVIVEYNITDWMKILTYTFWYETKMNETNPEGSRFLMHKFLEWLV